MMAATFDVECVDELEIGQIGDSRRRDRLKESIEEEGAACPRGQGRPSFGHSFNWDQTAEWRKNNEL